MNKDQFEKICSECFILKNQTTLAQYYWNKDFSECHTWLCKSCYWEKQIKLIIWEYEEEQAITNYLNIGEYLKQNKSK